MTETFPIVPGQVRLLWVAVPLVLLILGAAAALGYSLSGARRARFEVSPAGLRLRGDFYGRLVPAGDLRLDEARAVDLRKDRALEPVVRTGGTAVPGYRAGWFRLRDGERALLYVTDPSRVAYVPTRAGYSILVSVADPAAFLASLRRATGASPGGTATHFGDRDVQDAIRRELTRIGADGALLNGFAADGAIGLTPAELLAAFRATPDGAGNAAFEAALDAVIAARGRPKK